MSEKTASVDDRCRCGHFRDQHETFAGECRKCDGCDSFRDASAPDSRKETS